MRKKKVRIEALKIVAQISENSFSGNSASATVEKASVIEHYILTGKKAK